MSNSFKIQKIIGIFFIASLIIYLATSFLKTRLPDKNAIDRSLYNQPVQKTTETKKFEVTIGDLIYEVTPLYDYELNGLVVSDNDNEVWYSRFKKSDPMNTKDLCVIYGKNIEAEIYKGSKFYSEEFVCSFRTNDSATYAKFSSEDISNNHLLASRNDKAAIYKKLRKAKIGDQIKLKGYLAKYSIKENNGPAQLIRSSSTTRADAGMGACETIYLTDFNIIKTGNPIASVINIIFKCFSIFFFVLYFLMLLYPTGNSKNDKKETLDQSATPSFDDLLPTNLTNKN